MAKAKAENVRVSSEQQDSIRRAAKASKLARRKAEASKRKATQSNYRIGFKFAANGNLQAVIDEQVRKDTVERLRREGKLVNEIINGLLDEVDTRDYFDIDLTRQTENTDEERLFDQAIRELSGWIEKNPNRYSAHTTQSGHLRVGKLRKAA